MNPHTQAMRHVLRTFKELRLLAVLSNWVITNDLHRQHNALS